MAELPSGTVTFLFTDIEGSTQLVKRLRGGYAELLADHQRILRGSFEEAGGHEIDTQGDSFFVAFRRAGDAVAAAVAGQRGLAAHEWPKGVELKVRMGLHTGEPSVGGERYVGLAVHRAARVGAAAHGGQVLVSAVTRGLVEEDLPDGVSLRDLGEHGLKGLDRPERLFQVVIAGLQAEFPAPNTVRATALPVTGREVELGKAAEAALGEPRRLEFEILGPLEVSADGRPLPLRGQKQRAVLALLLLDAGRVVSTDRLIDALWGEQPPRTAATSLQNFVSQLRKLIGSDVLVTKPPGYILRIEPEQLDLGRFRRLVEESRGAEPAKRASLLREALDLWHGPPLAEFRFEAFAQNEIARLEELRLVALEERIDADLEAGRHTDVVGELESLVEEHPVRERLREQLMLALYRSGRQAEALELYQDARRRLVEDLGIDPSPRLQELYGAILRQESGLVPGAAPRTEDHFEQVVQPLLAGRVVTVLSADVAELAAELGRRFGYSNGRDRLPQVAQYIAVMKGHGPLYDELHDLLASDLPPTPVHRFFASLPPLLRSRGAPHQLIVTTSYDTAIEQAFADAGEEFDVVSYLASGRNRGRFCHIAPDGSGTLIELPNTYATELSLDRRTVILKVHGQVVRSDTREWESFVVTEDDYIGYLAQTDLAGAIPVSLAAKLRRSHFLFLGYTMADWNLRVILHRLWGEDPLGYRSWAVQPEPKPLEREFWRRRDVDVLELPLDEYVDRLARRLAAVAAESQT
jgi:DNA-binding SARP family transcriptional activator/class 3 adenylate cyclase